MARRSRKAASEFVAELQRDKGVKLTEQTRGQHEAVFRLFSQYIKDAPLTAVDRALASKFHATISTLAPNWGRSPHTKKLTLWELPDRFGEHPEGLSNRTINRYASSLAGLFKVLLEFDRGGEHAPRRRG